MKFYTKKRLFLGSIILALALLAGFTHLQPAVHAEDTRVITIHIDGEERTVASNAETVKDVLEKIETPLGKNDKTEPELDAKITGNDFTVNVYRARPVTVVDGINNYTVMTAERSPRQIAKQAGFTTKTEDKFGFQRSEDPFEGAPGTQMVIKRSQTIQLDLYGVVSSLNTHEQTVGALLSDKNIVLEEGDELSVPKEARITEGMTLSITNVSRKIETIEEAIPFEEEKIQDVNQPASFKEIKTPGTAGKKLVTYEIISLNGGAPERVVKEEVITTQPVKQVVVVGAKSFDGDFGAALAKLRSCEGNYNSWNAAGPYYGAYQFDQRTWSSVSSAPYGNATPAQQDEAAHNLYLKRGWQPWPNCGRGLPDSFR